MGQITLICGTGFSERSDRIDRLWREHGEAALLLTPTRRLARMRQEAFVRKNQLPGLWGNRAYELTAFAASLLETSGTRVRMVSRLERQFMVRQLLEDLQTDTALVQYPCTPGLVKHVLRLITQMKQAAIEPARFRETLASGRDASDTDLYVAAVYEAYQKALVAGNRYDVPGLYWEADMLCRNGGARVPGGASVLLLDEFDDFTPSQQRFLESLSGHVSRMVIGINHNVDPDQDGLFHLQERWVEEFRGRHGVEVVVCPSYPPRTAVHYAGASMFRCCVAQAPGDLENNLRVVPCADAQHELEHIGRAVKGLLVKEQLPPSSIAVALADMPQSVAMLCSVFEGFGIPFRLQAPPSLFSSAPGVVLSRLFDLFPEWESQNLVGLLTTPLLGDEGEQRDAVMSFPLTARECGVMAGREAWRDALDTLKRQLAADPERTGRNGSPAGITPEGVALFRQRFDLFATFEDSLPEEGTVAAYARLCDAFLVDSGMAHACRDNAANAGALSALHALLQDFALGDLSSVVVTCEAFAGLLRDGMADSCVFVEGRPGGVYCCGIEGLRCESFSHVFLGGLNEGVLPRPAPRSALYSELDLVRLRRRGMDLAGRSEHTYRERLLFHHAVRAAQKTLTLTWRKQDKTGRESLPSPFLVDLMERFETDSGVSGPDPGPDCFVPDEDTAASPRDLANVVIYRGNAALGSVFPVILDPIERRAAVESERNSTNPFDIYDGVIQAPDLKAHLAAEYGPETQFSTNHLESYLQFPFNFFLKRVLRIRETGEVEDEMDSLLRGVLLHDILHRFHRYYRGAALAGIPAGDAETCSKVMYNAIDESFDAHRYQLRTIPASILRVERRRFERALLRYLEHAGYLDADYAPCYFETAFGRVPKEDQDDLSRPEPFVMEVDGVHYRFSGKIDRIDRNGDVVRLVDYKTGGIPAKKSITTGLSLQLTLYSWAVEQHLLPGVSAGSAYYLSVFKGKMREALLRGKQGESDEREATARARLTEAIAGIRSGYFPPRPDEDLDLNMVDFPSAARYEGWRIARKVGNLDGESDGGDDND